MDIPLLKPIHDNINLINNFNICIDEILDKLYMQEEVYILDIFENTLKNDDKRIKELENEYFKLYNEEKYLNFLKEIFEINNKICYIKVTLNLKEYKNILYYIEHLDRIDKYILLENFKKLNTIKSDLYKINDLNLLNLFAKGILREIFNCFLFFPKDKIYLFSNYDLSLPIVFTDRKKINTYKNIAQKHSLFIRV